MTNNEHNNNSAERRWWIGLLVIVAVAAIFRVVGYNFSLPYVDHPDEPVFYLTALEWRGLFDNQAYLTGYPPLYIWLIMGVQVVMETLGITSMAAAVAVLRLISAGFSLLTLILSALTARSLFPRGSLAGDAAGWIAGGAWGVAPLVVENAIYATPDPLLYLLVSAALYLGVRALTEPNATRIALWSVVGGGLAILAKYFTLTAVLPGLVAVAMVWRMDRRRGIRLAVISIVILAAVIAIAVAGILVVPREGATAREGGFANILNVGRVANNIYHALVPLNFTAFALIVGLGAVSWFAGKTRAKVLPIAVTAALIVTIPWLAATFSEVNVRERMKDVLPATAAACVVLGVTAAQIMSTLTEFSARRRPKLAPLAAVIVPLALAVGVLIPHISTSTTILQNRLLPDARVALRLWADENLEPGTVLVGEDNHKTFNPFWGGIVGRQWFDWWLNDDWAALPPAEWRAQHGISYAVIERNAWAGQTSGAWLADALPLRTFGAPTRSPEYVVVRLWTMQQPLEARFGTAIRLVGADLPATTATAGASLPFRFYWQADNTPPSDYSLFIHFTPLDADQPLAQVDGAPASPARPTYAWNEPSETLIGTPLTLTLPTDLSAGRYRVRIGLYDYQTGVRLLLSGGSDVYELMEVMVE